MHGGCSVSRANEDLGDAVLLGSKRIAHGLSLAKHPHLTQLVKQNNICIELLPGKNLALGYCTDMRTHPARALLTKGIKCSINPTD